MATHITFIVGNGLDVSLGLKTTYRDFYKYVQDNGLNSQNRIYNQIAQDPETWADFETALGKYTMYIAGLPENKRQAESMVFHEELDDVRNDLAEYLKTQESSIENLSDSFRLASSTSGFYDGLNIGQKTRIDGMLNTIPIYLNFITLNYTGTLEKILSGDVTFNPNVYKKSSPLHLHGYADAYLTLGVNDESQLYIGMSEREKRDLIKQHLIDSANDGRFDDFRRIISGSTLIVLFGTSLGQTDAYIWKEVINWLYLRDSNHILIHKHDRTYTPLSRRSVRTENMYIDKVQEQLLQYADLDEGDKIDLKRRIFVIHNTNRLFVPKK